MHPWKGSHDYLKDSWAGSKEENTREISLAVKGIKEGTKTMRIGQGYDVHRLVEGRKLILGGVEIPYDKGLLGHSDADVLIHAVMDALLGAAALGDIGQHFPDTDPAYKGISSIELLRKVGKLLEQKGYIIENIDATIIAQRPKLAAYRPQMARNIEQALNLEEGRVSVKATTEEGLGFTGPGEGLSSQAITLLTAMRDTCYDDRMEIKGCTHCLGCKQQESAKVMEESYENF